MGSPCYMSPEQMRNAGLVDRRTDVWAMGAVLFELLAGAPPFDGASLPEICAHVMCDAPRSLKELRPGLPAGVEAAVSRCLEKDRDNRFSDVAELARALEPYASPDGTIQRSQHRAHHVEQRATAAFGRAAPIYAKFQCQLRTHPSRAVDCRAPKPGGRGERGPCHAHPGRASALALGAQWRRDIGSGRRWHGPLLGLRRFSRSRRPTPAARLVIPGNLHENAADVRPVMSALEAQFPAKRGFARAEREHDAPTGSSAEPTLVTSTQAPLRGARPQSVSTPAEAPHEPVIPLSPDNPYAPVAP